MYISGGAFQVKALLAIRNLTDRVIGDQCFHTEFYNFIQKCIAVILNQQSMQTTLLRFSFAICFQYRAIQTNINGLNTCTRTTPTSECVLQLPSKLSHFVLIQ